MEGEGGGRGVEGEGWRVRGGGRGVEGEGWRERGGGRGVEGEGQLACIVYTCDAC